MTTEKNSIENEIDIKVKEALAKKEEAELLKASEEALTKASATITSLTTSLEAKDVELKDKEAELASVKESIVSLESKIKELETEKATLDEEKKKALADKDEVVKRAEAAELELANIKKDQIAESRIKELREANVASSSEQAAIKQKAKVRDLSDEDFAAYKAELVSVRESIVAELNKQSANQLEQKTESAALESKPAINPAQAVAAALNMEIVPTKDVKDRYNQLGNAMAARLTKATK